MLPDDVWEHYYDQTCEVCHGTIPGRDQTVEYCNCAICGVLMCEDCITEAQVACSVCQDKIEDGDDDWDSDIDKVCVGCLESCTGADCDVKFHKGKCALEHPKTCNPRGRAKRECHATDTALFEAESRLFWAKRDLEAAEEAVASAKKAKIEASDVWATFEASESNPNAADEE